MYDGRIIFAQLVDFLPRKAFGRRVKKYKGDSCCKDFSRRGQFLAMAFAQITNRGGQNARALESPGRYPPPKSSSPAHSARCHGALEWHHALQPCRFRVRYADDCNIYVRTQKAYTNRRIPNGTHGGVRGRKVGHISLPSSHSVQIA